MGMQINNNLMANNSLRNVNNTQDALSKSLEKLSSGLRINRAADDAAGLSISEGLRSQVSGLAVAQRNTQDGISVIGVAEGALQEVHTILHRQRDLAVQAANDSNSVESRKAITTESKALTDELARISATTNFNGINLLDATAAANGLTFQVGAGADPTTEQIKISLVDISKIATDQTKAQVAATPSAPAGVDAAGAPTAATAYAPATGGLDFTDATKAAGSISILDAQIEKISEARSDLGASQNRLESAGRSLAVAKENLGAAESRIRDTDMAAEMVNYTKANILQQAGVSMLSQANQSGQAVLKLLG